MEGERQGRSAQVLGCRSSALTGPFLGWDLLFLTELNRDLELLSGVEGSSGKESVRVLCVEARCTVELPSQLAASGFLGQEAREAQGGPSLLLSCASCVRTNAHTEQASRRQAVPMDSGKPCPHSGFCSEFCPSALSNDHTQEARVMAPGSALPLPGSRVSILSEVLLA